MVRRLLLTALLATLAVALPAAAEEDPAPASGPEPSADPGCLSLDPFCLPVVDDAWSEVVTPAFGDSLVAPGIGEADCRVFDLSGQGDPLHVVDPDGCWWRLIRRTLGIGVETSLSVGSWVSDRVSLPFP